MNWTATIDSVSEGEKKWVGGKGAVLVSLRKKGLTVPETGIVTTEAYKEFISQNGLKERIALELSRKEFEDMRWEEMWDASLRIRNFFLTTPVPLRLDTALRDFINTHFRDAHVVVRSSAPEEDSATTSFAGIHESFVDVFGVEEILQHIKLVWASLWSDKALLYRRELRLNPHKSLMAVLIQKIIRGTCSGIVFSLSPNDESQGVVESIYGLNQDLVDGSMEPYRWILDRRKKTILSFVPPQESDGASPEGSRSARKRGENGGVVPPLTGEEAIQVFSLALQLEADFGRPQDIEWTLDGNELYVLQSRPVTTVDRGNSQDSRGWYLSLHRSVKTLFELWKRIEKQLIPAMIEEASRMSAVDVSKLSDAGLAKEITFRSGRYDYWKQIYHSEFIPFAHGMRVFGQFYNKAVRPEDPYEFVRLLMNEDMESLKRNQLLEELASMVREDATIQEKLSSRELSGLDRVFRSKMEKLLDRFGQQFSALSPLSHSEAQCDALVALVLKMASQPQKIDRSSKTNDCQILEKRFLNHFHGEERSRAVDMLKLARASYRLRDDDNIHLGRIEGELISAIREGKDRIRDSAGHHDKHSRSALFSVLDQYMRADNEPTSSTHGEDSQFTYKARQLVGQPAGPGLAKGPACVIRDRADLLACAQGDILICDAIDPDMTFIIPVVDGIVERRGGMLIHGAIIAREYGIPCVTGISRATSRIRKGDFVTVDGYLGIVTIG